MSKKLKSTDVEYVSESSNEIYSALLKALIRFSKKKLCRTLARLFDEGRMVRVNPFVVYGAAFVEAKRGCMGFGRLLHDEPDARTSFLSSDLSRALCHWNLWYERICELEEGGESLRAFFDDERKLHALVGEHLAFEVKRELPDFDVFLPSRGVYCNMLENEVGIEEGKDIPEYRLYHWDEVCPDEAEHE